MECSPRQPRHRYIQMSTQARSMTCPITSPATWIERWCWWWELAMWQPSHPTIRIICCRITMTRAVFFSRWSRAMCVRQQSGTTKSRIKSYPSVNSEWCRDGPWSLQRLIAITMRSIKAIYKGCRMPSTARPAHLTLNSRPKSSLKNLEDQLNTKNSTPNSKMMLGFLLYLTSKLQ